MGTGQKRQSTNNDVEVDVEVIERVNDCDTGNNDVEVWE